ncbi:LysR family transcriptional regulator [Devosia sp. PTR5]|jgi:DNA-binding transcriptional LysR family regulator|uniref:LysR family transcriptional regulator n=1 Tax=Devosia oryzisoli TaxID=2774138 RepID=A0A927FVL8_9HYPH|nr:LysR family transcriptional regulator [Devosia oryzisoli]MBD8065969.1 LysR family transcriptional regulator [Devosia oryzisoli]
MKINLHQILAFNAAARHRSFSKAAEALGVTQSSVTQNVAKFEAVVGAYLLERRRSGLVLTPAGRRIHRVTEEMGLLQIQLEERVNEFTGLEQGLLRVVGTASNPALTYLRRFRERHPGVDLTFESANWRKCEEILKEREVDVVIMPEPENTENLYVWPIEHRQHVVLIPDDHALSGRRSISLRDLAEHHIVLPSSRSFARWRLETEAANLGVTLKKLMVVSSTAMAVEAVYHGLGVTVTSPDTTTLAQNLKSVILEELAEPYLVVAACNADARNTGTVKGFFDCMD